MKLKDTVVISLINDSYYLVDSDDADNRYNGLIRLNETSKDIVESFMVETTRKEVIDKILDEYDVTYERLSADVDKILCALKEADLIIE